MPVLAYFHQAIAESGSALSGWAFDSSPESHAHEIASTHLGCPTDSTTALVGCSHISSNVQYTSSGSYPVPKPDSFHQVNCLKNEKTFQDIVLAHGKYVVSRCVDM